MVSSYASYYGEEIKDLINWTETKIAQIDTAKDLYLTECLCRCFLATILDLIKGALGAIGVRSTTASNVIYRSLLEHAIDLKLLSILNDKTLNKKFANYYKIILYKNRHMVETYKSEIPRIEEEYRTYVIDEFPDIIESIQTDSSSTLVSDWTEIDKQVWNRNRNHWSGLSFPDRVIKIEKNMLESGSKSSYAVIDVDPLISMVKFFWYAYSTYTHPTPFSALPHFSSKYRTFEWMYNPQEKDLSKREARLFLILDYCLEAFSTLTDSELHLEFKNKVDECPKLHAYLFKK